jgi:hypothetical protein
MAFVLLIGLGLAAQWNATEFWASVTYTLAIMGLATAPISALTLRGTARLTWAGYAVFDWIYLFVGLLPPWSVDPIYHGSLRRPPLLIEWGLANLNGYVRPAGSFDLQNAERVSHSLAIILFSLVGAVVGRVVARSSERPIP